MADPMADEVPGALTTSDGVRLEARWRDSTAGRGSLVLCHPHPLYGGDMDSPVVVRLAEVAAEAGLGTLRFNFRGVGGSGGSHDGGRGEQRDVAAALAHLRTRGTPDRPLFLGGYSFGAAMAARVATAEPDLAGLVLVAPAVSVSGAEPFAALASWRGPVLVVAGTQDQFCSAADLEALHQRLPSAEVVRIEGANHFFFGRLFPLGEALRHWLGQRDRAGQA